METREILDNIDKAIRELSLESVYAEGIANKALADLGVIYRIVSSIESLAQEWDKQSGREGFAPSFANEFHAVIILAISNNSMLKGA